MKIIFIANADDNWFKEYLERIVVGKFESLEVAVCSLKNTVYKDYYIENNISVYTYYSDKGPAGRILHRWFLDNKIKRKYKDVDAIHVHMVNDVNITRLKKIWKVASKHIVTFWGSDIFRVSDNHLKKYSDVFCRVDTINLLNENMFPRFTDIYGHEFDDKLTGFDFGCPMYEAIDSIALNMSKIDCKEYLGIAGEDILVPVGYNSSPEQQHDKIISAVSSVDEGMKSKIVLLIHFCYNEYSDSEYISEVKGLLEKSGFRYKIIDRVLDKREISILRRAADIFLYAQTTDALSASVIEYLYSGCLLVKPDWLSYPELDSRSVKYISYSDFEQLKDAFLEAIDIYDDENRLKEYQNNRDILWNMNSWEVVAPKWRALYED